MTFFPSFDTGGSTVFPFSGPLKVPCVVASGESVQVIVSESTRRHRKRDRPVTRKYTGMGDGLPS